MNKMLRFIKDRIINELLISKIFYSFPVQLFLLNFKKNQILFLLWLLLFALILQETGTVFGLPNLFLDPEYRNKVDFWSFFIVGLAIGGFTMSYHIACYIIDGHRFKFLGNLKHPFAKFCLNNSLIPLTFIVIYIVQFVHFQESNQFEKKVWIEATGFMSGFLLTLTFFLAYFTFTNKDIFKIMANVVDKQLKKSSFSRANIMARYQAARRSIRVDYYFDEVIRFKAVTKEAKVDREAILKVFDQNHFNSVIIQSFIFVIILIIGSYRENAYLQIPAGASVVILFSIFMMFMGAFSFWLRAWSFSVFIMMMLGLNFLIERDVLNIKHEAYGLNYDTLKAEYSLKRIRALNSDSIYKADYVQTEKILDNWREKFPKNEKPKMIFICASGGGQRAAYWTMRTLQIVDSTLGGQLMDHTALMTGASGGIIGAAYFRALFLEQQLGEYTDIYASEYLDNIGKDNLNAIVFSWIINDIFFKYQKFQYANMNYKKDRGYAFEEQLNKNTLDLMNVPLSFYKTHEEKAIIPLLVLSPTIVNDARKLYISPHNMSYLNVASLNQTRFLNRKTKGVDFLRFFEDQNADSLRFLSALRMSASFPYITPSISLPSHPSMQIMDAGLSDNFGVDTAVRFLFVFKKWIQENTSGVIFVTIRDSQKDQPIEESEKLSLFERVFTPLRGIYGNHQNLQDLRNDTLIEFVQAWFDHPNMVQKVDFQYVPVSKSMEEIRKKAEGIIKVEPNKIVKIERAALSWRLTEKEKESIRRTIYEFRNQSALRHLSYILNGE